MSSSARLSLAFFVLCVCAVGGMPIAAADAAFLYDSVLDYAESITDEIESNDTPATAQDLGAWFAAGIRSVGITGELSPAGDVDYYAFTAGQAATLDLKFELLDAVDKDLAVLAVDGDRVYFAVDSTLWALDRADDAVPQVLVTAAELAGAGAAPGAAITAIAAGLDPNDPLALAVEPGGYLDDVVAFSIAAGGAIPGLTLGEVTAVTFADTTELASLAHDPNSGDLYLLDTAWGGVLRATPDPAGGAWSLAVHTSADTLADAIERDLLGELQNNSLSMPRTAIASTEDEFQVNAFVRGTGDYDVPGFDTYYLSQLGPEFDGAGGITLVTINQAEPNDILFEAFFDPNEAQQDLNPSALALQAPGQGSFAGRMFAGTFGPSLGDDFDGQLFEVAPDGTLTGFITDFVDLAGDPAVRNGLQVTGLFDVTDMAFPPTTGGPFGDYLYVISENIDQNGPAPDGFSSDLWRVGPDGTAELFVENVADGAISLAFGPFGYGNDLFVATFQGGRIYRVSPAGAVSLFFDFSQFGSSLMVSDLVFTPDDLALEPLAGTLLLTLKSGNATFLVAIMPDGETYQTWASSLSTGDVSSGDLLFDPDGDLVVSSQTDGLVRIDYQGVLDTRFDGLALRREVLLPGDPNETIEYVPYLLATVGDRPRILRLGDGGLDEIATEATPATLELADVPDETPEPLRFTFAPDGNLFVWIEHLDQLRWGTRAADGMFRNLTVAMNPSSIPATGLADPTFAALQAGPDGGLFALARNGDDETLDPAQLEFDDLLLSLGSATGTLGANALLGAAELTRAQVVLAGPGDPNTFDVAAGTILDRQLTGLEAGQYTLRISSPDATAGPYELLVGLDADFAATYAVTPGDSPRTFTMVSGDRLEMRIDGRGQAELTVHQRPDGVIIALESLSLSGTNAGAVVSLANLDNAGELSVGTVTLDGSLRSLAIAGDIELLAGAGRGVIRSAELGAVREVDAPRYAFLDLTAEALGEPEEDDLVFDAARLVNLHVTGDLDGVTFFAEGDRNAYGTVVIDGVATGAAFYGRTMREFRIRNTAGLDEAMIDSEVDLNTDGGALVTAVIERGHVVDSTLGADRMVGSVEVLAGNLVGSTVGTLHRSGRVGRVEVLSPAGAPSDETAGNIIGSVVVSPSRIDRVHADGTIDADSNIVINGTGVAGLLNIVTCGGQCGASISGPRINRVLVGYDRSGAAIPEDDDFTGSDLTGSVSATIGIKEVNVTGAIRDAQVIASFGYIFNLYAEDGFLDSSASAGRVLRRMMVGYENGNRGRIVNTDADVSGRVSTGLLGRIYYTGSADDLDLDVNRQSGPVHDDVPGN